MEPLPVQTGWNALHKSESKPNKESLIKPNSEYCLEIKSRMVKRFSFFYIYSHTAGDELFLRLMSRSVLKWFGEIKKSSSISNSGMTDFNMNV